MSFALVITPVLLFVLSLAFALPVLARLFRRCHLEEIAPDWLESFSPSVYYPMQGLLSTEDFDFLSCQPGFDLSLYNKLRKDRLRIFRQYLNRLVGDFNRLHEFGRTMLSQMEGDHSDLFAQLVWLKVRFSITVLRVEVSYWLCRMVASRLALGGLIPRLEEMGRQLNLIAEQRLISRSYAS